MNFSIKGFLTVTSLASLVACSQAVPECGSTQAIGLVKQILVDNIVSNTGYTPNDIGLSITAVRTKKFSEEAAERECAAELTMIDKPQGKTDVTQITYTVELTDAGDQIYVTVY